VESLNLMTDVSDPPYGHKMSVYIFLKTDKIGYKQKKTRCN